MRVKRNGMMTFFAVEITGFLTERCALRNIWQLQIVSVSSTKCHVVDLPFLMCGSIHAPALVK